jgi:hypothetical protein
LLLKVALNLDKMKVSPFPYSRLEADMAWRPAEEPEWQDRETRKRHDEASKVARMSGGALDGSQVRILRALAGVGKEIDRGTLGDLCGIRRPRNPGGGRFSNNWHASLRDLYARGLVAIRDYEGLPLMHVITPLGKRLLKAAEDLLAVTKQA